VIAALALVLVLGTVAYAADAPATYGAGQCANFVDANGDGVCDNLGQNVPPRDGTGSQYGTGSQNNGQYGAGQGQAAVGTGVGGNGSFVDADNDGVCDNLGQNVPPRDGTGSQNGKTTTQRGGHR
jgi:hypothetical protein